MDKDAFRATIETVINLDEPEALLSTLRKAAIRKASGDHWKGLGIEEAKRWLALAQVLGEAEVQLDLILNAKPAGPDFRPLTQDEIMQQTARAPDLEEIEAQAGGPLDPDSYGPNTKPPPPDAGPQMVDPPAKAK